MVERTGIGFGVPTLNSDYFDYFIRRVDSILGQCGVRKSEPPPPPQPQVPLANFVSEVLREPVPSCKACGERMVFCCPSCGSTPRPASVEE